MPEILFLDFETACALDLKKSGASRYSRDPSLIVTVVGWAFDDDPAQAETVLTLGPRRLPPAVEDHIRGGGLVSGWNSRNFEANILRNYFGLAIPHAQITDTMQAALHGGLPAALGDAGPALGLPIVKDATAHRLMLQMARPRAIRPDGSYRWWHEDDAEKLERLRLYCAQDVEAERAISKSIPQLPEHELRVALLDARANAKGVRVDVPAVRQLIAIADASTKRLNAECVRLTNGQVSSPGSQTARLLAWLGPFAPPDLTKDSVARALARDDLPPHIRRVLEIRQLAAKSSVKKLQAALSCVDEDDAIRGMLAYYGASRTGRWAGRLFQPQNLVRPSLKDPDLALDLIADGADVDLIEALFGPPLEVVSSCLRGILIPRPGHAFVVFDLSQIEARMVAWLAGQEDILDVFARGDDVYTFTANKLGLPSRQAGKVCVAESTLVLTSRGWIRIESLRTSDQLWDGEQWVSHSGLVNNGRREVLTGCGVPLTPEHLVLCGKTWLPAKVVCGVEAECGGSTLSLALATASENLPSPETYLEPRAAASSLLCANAVAGLQSILSLLAVLTAGARPDATLARKSQLKRAVKSISDTLKFALTKTTALGYLIVSPRASVVATTRTPLNTKTTEGAESTFMRRGVNRSAWGVWPKDEPTFSLISSHWTVGTARSWSWIASTWTKVTSPETYGSYLGRKTHSTNGKSGSFSGVLKNSKPKSNGCNKTTNVYDILNSGPRNRFTIMSDHGPLIVHNCVLGLGFGLGKNRFVDFAATYGLTYSAAEAEKIVRDWRAANPMITAFWRACDKAVRGVLEQPTNPFTVKINGRVSATVTEARDGSRLLTLLLPSGRRLYYRNAMISEGDDSSEVVYAGVDQKTRKWGLQRAFGPKTVENLTQAAARDVIVHMALEIERKRLGDVILSVHDELIVEVPLSDAKARYEAIKKIMNTAPDWAKGLPVKAEGHILERYGK